MLWYKAWLETRFRILFLVFGSLLIAPSLSRINSSSRVEQLIHVLIYLWISVPIMLAGAGIKTQAPLQTTKGLHGSMYFTLSLPVSRFRLLTVRATMGMLEVIVVIAGECLALWFVAPILGMHLTRSDALEYFAAVLVCALGFYCLSLLLTTFLDDLWQIWGSMIVIGFLFWLSNTSPVPQSLNFFRALADSSPLFTHTLPLTIMGVSLGAAAILFLAAVKVVQLREY
jgi:hypothetical protein